MPDGITAAPGPGATAAAPGDRAHASRGFILVMLLAFIASMGIFLTVAMPNVATEVQRDQEAELIFRGEAISNAIKLYKTKTGGYPLTLEDLTKIRPRILRRLYQDPMTPDGEWDLITAVQPGTTGDKAGLPIVGVRSHCQKDSFAVYHGKTLISDWTFSAADNLLGVPGANNPAATALLDSQTGKKAPQPGEDPSNLGPPIRSTNPAPASPTPASPTPANPTPDNPAPANPATTDPAQAPKAGTPNPGDPPQQPARPGGANSATDITSSGSN